MPGRLATLLRLCAGAALAVSALAPGASGVAAHVPAAPGRHSAGSQPGHRLSPQPGPQQLHTVPPDAYPPIHGGDRRFGVVSALADPSVADALHIGWERVGLGWNFLQIAGPGTWNGANTGQDAPFDAELAHGRQLIGIVTGVPSWAALDPGDGNRAVPKGLDYPWTDPRNYWGQFIYRLARHYAGRIDTFIIGNEIDLAYAQGHSVTFANFAGTPQQYAQMVRVAYLAAHAANPHVAIHLYGDSVYGDYGHWFGQTLDALAAFPDARANGLFFDAAEVHLYSTVLRWDWIIGIFQGIMRAHHVDKPIWLTETNTLPRDDSAWPLAPDDSNATQAVQTDFIVHAYAAALGVGFARVEIYKMRDGLSSQGDHPLGIVRYNGTVRPEAAAFKTVATWLSDVTGIRYDAGSPPASYAHPLFRVTMQRPGQEVQVLWDHGKAPLIATVPAVARTATLVSPDGKTRTVQASGGVFTIHLSGATDASLHVPNTFIIGGTPVIVVQNLPRGYRVPGLHALVGEQSRTPVADSPPGPLTGIALAPDGSGTRAIADPAHDRVLVESAQGHLTAVIGHTGGAPGEFRGPAGVAIGPDGTLYVADQGNARIQEFTLSGRLLGGFGSDQARGAEVLDAPASLAVAPDGTLYVVDVAQDAVLHFTRMGQFLGRWGSYGSGAAQFDGPGGIAVDGQGTVYVADTLNNRVEAFDGAGHPLLEIGTGQPGSDGTRLHWPSAVTVLPGGGVAISDVDNTRVVTVAHPQTYLGAATIAPAARPLGLAVAADGSYYLANTGRNSIVHLSATGRSLATYTYTGHGPGQTFRPQGLAIGPDGNIYVAIGATNRIIVLTPGLHYVRTIGGYGHAPGQFVGPYALSVARDGTLWVADTDNARIEHLSPSGAVLGMITNVNGAFGVAADNHGGVYYAMRWGQHVYHWHPGGHVDSWGGSGSGAGEFSGPIALAATPDGNTVYVVDEGNRRIQFIVHGRVTGQRGGNNPGPSGLGDPVAVAVARDGTIAVLDDGRKGPRIARYAGATAGRFSTWAAHDVPLGLSGDAHGTIVALCGPWSGSCALQRAGGHA